MTRGPQGPRLARPIDCIHPVQDAGDRDARFPSPPLHWRVQRLDTGAIQRWTGNAWVTMTCAEATPAVCYHGFSGQRIAERYWDTLCQDTSLADFFGSVDPVAGQSVEPYKYDACSAALGASYIQPLGPADAWNGSFGVRQVWDGSAARPAFSLERTITRADLGVTAANWMKIRFRLSPEWEAAIAVGEEITLLRYTQPDAVGNHVVLKLQHRVDGTNGGWWVQWDWGANNGGLYAPRQLPGDHTGEHNLTPTQLAWMFGEWLDVVVFDYELYSGNNASRTLYLQRSTPIAPSTTPGGPYSVLSGWAIGGGSTTASPTGDGLLEIFPDVDLPATDARTLDYGGYELVNGLSDDIDPYNII